MSLCHIITQIFLNFFFENIDVFIYLKIGFFLKQLHGIDSLSNSRDKINNKRIF